MRPSLARLWLPLALLAGSGCATAFSPATIRDEIVRQTGQDPRRAFEFTLGPTTMSLARAVVGNAGSQPGGLPLAGLDALELAAFEAPPATLAGGGLDFTRMPIRGWEPVVKTRDGARSALVLVRGARDDSVGELVLVAAGEEQVLYARLQGRLDRRLPEALADAVKSSGTEGVKDALMSLSGPAPR
ncbi:MAG: hypothetical protein MUC67_12025 [Acidobacteria bacterium]|jgi:hypothetical protein|nr:hypothetical protein [Acidobacteriota bacterium]MCU0253711.1 hypothetical protein [Acidobacteriota bacterium]